jgi:NADH:ubiquinone oxidoreductase subunit F (NADH-binding)
MEQTRYVMANVGVIDPNSLADYRGTGGYTGLANALAMTPAEVIDLVNTVNLRGRGGAGFPVGRKWAVAASNPCDQRYIVCNADEGEPATNKDRWIMRGNPHGFLEGMIIAGYATGATRGFVYLRYEYPKLFGVLRKTIADARAAGLLGSNILGSGFDFDIEVVTGGGAYVCGEETALLTSIEGMRGEPRLRPPYPGVKGLFGAPTVVNNVETLANVPLILADGGARFARLGTDIDPGTKVFTVCGNVERAGVYEYPMGTNLYQIIASAGGVRAGRGLLGVQIGGCSGALLNAFQLDLPMDEDSCRARGAMMGSGGIQVIADGGPTILDVVENAMQFFVHESCGQCTPCREGCVRMYDLVAKINRGEGCQADIDLMLELCDTLRWASLCALGQSVANPIESSYHNFRAAYDRAIAKEAMT